MLGNVLNQHLCSIESVIVDFDAKIGDKPNYSDEAFRAATKIFMSCLMDKMFDLMEAEKHDQKAREKAAEMAGNELHAFVKKWTGINTREMYEKR